MVANADKAVLQHDGKHNINVHDFLDNLFHFINHFYCTVWSSVPDLLSTTLIIGNKGIIDRLI